MRVGSCARRNVPGWHRRPCSGQIATLETDLGVNLFKRQGRGLVLTETGRMVLDYAEEIFRLGNELEEALQSRATGRAVPFRVGIADVVPKAIAWLLLAPSMDLPEPMRIVCREGKFDALLGELAIHKLDVVLADSPLPPAMDVRGSATRSASRPSASTPHPRSPPPGRRLPPASTAPRCCCQASRPAWPLLRWIEAAGLRPRIVGEFDDSALMRAFAEAGAGIFPSASLVGEQLCRQGGLVHLGDANGVTETYYAISVERRLTHPAVRAISEGAHAKQNFA